MHFIGMSALSLYLDDGTKLTISYRIDLTVTSLVAVLVLTYVGIYIATMNKAYVVDKADVVDDFIRAAHTMSIQEIKQMPHKHVIIRMMLFKNLFPLFFGGACTAAGVCVMHYTGMMAMVMDARVRWDPGTVAASVIIALVAATAAYWILFRLLAIFPFLETLRVACAVLMAIAVNGMHYTGMAAATWYYDPGRGDRFSNQIVSSKTAMNAALDAAIIFICAILIASLADIRIWYHNLGRTLREIDCCLVEAKQVTGADVDGALRDFMGHYERLRQMNGSERNLKIYRENSRQFGDKSFSLRSHHLTGPRIAGQNSIRHSNRSNTEASHSVSIRNFNTNRSSRSVSRVVPGTSESGRDGGSVLKASFSEIEKNLEERSEAPSEEPIDNLEPVRTFSSKEILLVKSDSQKGSREVTVHIQSPPSATDAAGNMSMSTDDKEQTPLLVSRAASASLTFDEPTERLPGTDDCENKISIALIKTDGIASSSRGYESAKDAQMNARSSKTDIEQKVSESVKFRNTQLSEKDRNSQRPSAKYAFLEQEAKQ
jgi:NO-binding membrane sensor protein with MHYT domain